MIVNFPGQAVILCGGLGTRLRPYTFSKPKPMVDINGKPFLYYLLKQLSEIGITRYVLLLGYKSNEIINYFGNGCEYGWNIEYSIGDISWDTGTRILNASSMLDEHFILMYSDNFVQHKFDALFSKYVRSDSPLALHLSPKSEGNISLSDEDFISEYLPAKRSPKYPYVDLGYMIAEKKRIINLMNDFKHTNFSFSMILEKISSFYAVPSIIVYDDYHSIGDRGRLLLAREYLLPKKHILMDRDGVINQKAPRGKYITSWDDFHFIDDTINSMKELSENGYYFSILTNQAGLSTGVLKHEKLDEIHSRLSEYFSSLDISLWIS